jgi:hypothetical protein
VSLAPDQEFESSERLFRRIHPDHLAGGMVLDAFLPFPAFSVNREKYGLPEEVIRHHPSFGIASFTVGDIPEALEDPGGQVYRFGVEHRPEPENYAHSEVHSYRDGMTQEPSKTVRKRFRELLRRRILVLREPTR